MSSDELCDLLVDHFNELEDSPIAFQAIHPATTAEASKERSDWGVFVMPFEEREEPINLGNETCREELTPSVVVNGPIGPTVTKDHGIQLQKFLRESLKGESFGGYLWSGNEVIAAYGSEALRMKQFLSEFHPTFYAFA